MAVVLGAVVLGAVVAVVAVVLGAVVSALVSEAAVRVEMPRDLCPKSCWTTTVVGRDWTIEVISLMPALAERVVSKATNLVILPSCCSEDANEPQITSIRDK